MAEYLTQTTVDIPVRQFFIKAFPCFSALTTDQSAKLASLMQEIQYEPKEVIVTENDLVDSVYIIIKGEAEVTRQTKRRLKIINVPIASLISGEGIGLNDTGFYSTTGKRTATVTASSKMLVLRLDIKDLYAFLKKYNLELSMYAASEQMLRMRFIKQSLPFSKLSHERLQWLANHVKEKSVSQGTVLFKQGEQGDKCYLIRKGKIEIVAKDETGKDHQLAILKPPVLFGEATMITHSPRNATAVAMEDCDLFVLEHKHLSELIESEDNVASMFMTLMVDRSRPAKNPHVSEHQRTTDDGQELTILKNPDNGHYFKLSQEGAFVWHDLDGEHTMQEITMDLAEEHRVFAPDIVAGLISRLTRAGFISNIELQETHKSKSFLYNKFKQIGALLNFRYIFSGADQWVTRIYEKYMHYVFTKRGQILLGLFAALGFVTFCLVTPDVLYFFNYQHASWFLLLGLIPMMIIEVCLHELGHAFAVKAFGREVHYIGVGWNGTAPVAFTDTSDMWLSPRKPRMLVNLAGVYVDFLSAGLAALLMFVVINPYIQGLLWIFALYTYVKGVQNLSPLQDMDGYYILEDWVEKPRLRRSAVIWLVRIFPKALSNRKLFKEHMPEVAYWLACLFYLLFISVITLIFVGFMSVIMGTEPRLLLSLCFPVIVVIFVSLGVLMEIKNEAGED